MFYSLPEKCAHTLPALFTIAILTIAGFAQGKAFTGTLEAPVAGTTYDPAAYASSLRNLRSQPAPGRAAASSAAGEVDPALNPLMDSTQAVARATAVQPDGKIIVGGYFRTLNGVRYSNIVRLNADYSIDPTFSASVNGGVFSIALQPDGKIVIGGIFTAVGGTGQNYVARLMPNGSVDPTFNTSGGASGYINGVAVQQDGKILIGGTFTQVGGEFKPYAARLNADGSVDKAFTPNLPPSFDPNSIPSIVYGITPQADGKVILAGFINKSPSPGSAAPIVRLNTDGTIDASFVHPTISSNAFKAVVQPDGKILLAGFFANYGTTSRNRIMRLHPDGSLDMGFNPGTGFDGPVFSMELRANGSILAGGTFTTYNGTPRNNLALINADGSLDTSLVPGVFSGGTVYTTPTGADGRILMGGALVMPSAGRDTFALLSSTGALDTSLNMNATAPGGTRVIAVQPDGKILVGGIFSRVNGAARNRLVRFNANGTVDAGFNSEVNINSLTTLLVQPDGKILVGGLNLVRNVSGSTPYALVRLNADGSYDSSFTLSGVQARTAKALALQPDGKIIFSYTIPVLGINFSGDVSRLNSDGSVDSSFDGLALPFEALTVLPDGKILAGGPFGMRYVSTQTGSEPHIGMFRLNADGSHDRTFQSGLIADEGVAGASAVYTFERLPDGKILVGGLLYTSTASSSPVGVARLNANGSIDNAFHLNTISSAYEFPRVEDLQTGPDGKIVVGGLFHHIGLSAQNNVAKMNADGSVDSAFAASTDGTVFDLAIDAAGKVVIGGDFEQVNGTPRTGLARLLSEPAVHRTPYDFDGDGKADVSLFRPSEGDWYLLQSTAGFLGFHFGAAADKIAPADYDGDGKADFGVFRPSENTWYLQNSTTGFTAANFGIAEDIPQPGDFDGDGKAEIALWRPSEGNWYTMNLATGETSGFHFGTSGDKPAAGDYDGDGKMDYAVYRPSEGNWYLMKSTEGFGAFHFGVLEDVPVPADYDGDGKTDFGVFRPSEGNWYLMKSTEGFLAFHWGFSTDLPVPADYDGDAKADIAVFRDGQWYLQQSAAGYTVVNFGLAGDRPAPNSFVY
jgi:uncharacterized delta-60 repeat protein